MDSKRAGHKVEAGGKVEIKAQAGRISTMALILNLELFFTEWRLTRFILLLFLKSFFCGCGYVLEREIKNYVDVRLEVMRTLFS